MKHNGRTRGGMAGLLVSLAIAPLPGSGQASGEAEADVARGSEVYERWCESCHGTGHGKSGTIALQAKYQGSIPALLVERTDLSPELTRSFVRSGIFAMPFFRKTEISDADLEALAAFLAAPE